MVFSKLSLDNYYFLHKKLCLQQLQFTLFHVPWWILLYKYFSSWEILRNSSTIFRSSHQRCSIKKAILKDFVIFAGKHLCRGLFLIKMPAIRRVTLLKRDSDTYFLVNVGKFIRRPILKNISERLQNVLWESFSD